MRCSLEEKRENLDFGKFGINWRSLKEFLNEMEGNWADFILIKVGIVHETEL